MIHKSLKTGKAVARRNALAIALALSLGLTGGAAFAQATSGTIYGSAPSDATIQVTSTTGITRTIAVGDDGSYVFSALPAGTYTVTLMRDGAAVSARNDVMIRVGSGVGVDFGGMANAQKLSGVMVTASALPSIDVTAIHNSTVITAADLQRLPIGRNAESIALLTPGTVQGSAFFGGAVTFGGSSGAENAYYVNGYNTGGLYRNIGGYQLPYGAIAQQETLAGGFGAKYGRSDGGVISQIGKRGTNEWHFGAQFVWAPEALQSDTDDFYYPEQQLPTGPGDWAYSATYAPGELYNYNAQDKSWATTYTGYIGGPLIKDKLFIFVDAAYNETAGQTRTAITSKNYSYYSSHHNEYYAKLDWNINDNNILEATFLRRKGASGAGKTYDYDYENNVSTTFRYDNDVSTVDAKFDILKYTGYLTDNLTLSVLYGRANVTNPVEYGYKGADLPFIGGGANQNPAYWPPGTDPSIGIINLQPNVSVTAPTSELQSHGLRADLTYILGDHTLGAGIDNMAFRGIDQGTKYVGGCPTVPGIVKNPNHTDENLCLSGSRWQYYDFGGAYRVRYLSIANQGGMTTKQQAWYLQDNWQVTPTFQAILGIRNDHYINYNNFGQEFANLKNQWEPRVGFSWDVNGDSSLKLWGNAGRYYLALPLNAANRAAVSSTYVWQWFTYTGINPDGTPIGIVPDPAGFGAGGAHLISPDGEFGGPKDPVQVTAANLKPMYIDQFNVGADMKLGDNWVVGGALHYRDLKATIDDECSPGLIAAKMASLGLDPSNYVDSLYGAAYCRLINPGRTSNMLIKKNAGYDTGSGDRYVVVPMSPDDWGYKQDPKRRYESLDLYIEHPFDGKWTARADLTYANAKGNTAGQIRPDFGQGDVSKTEDWDAWQLMEGQDGELLNSRKWYLRLRGAYQITPDWLVSMTGTIKSGTPQECLGYYGPNADGDPVGYNGGSTGNYHWCLGRIVHPGSDDPLAGHAPWQHVFNVGVRWSPSFADHKLTVGLNVFNITDEQKADQTYPSIVDSYDGTTHVVNNFFHYPVSRTAARYARLSVAYDW